MKTEGDRAWNSNNCHFELNKFLYGPTLHLSKDNFFRFFFFGLTSLTALVAKGQPILKIPTVNGYRLIQRLSSYFFFNMTHLWFFILSNSYDRFKSMQGFKNSKKIFYFKVFFTTSLKTTPLIEIESYIFFLNIKVVKFGSFLRLYCHRVWIQYRVTFSWNE